ncbi:GLIPR1-like protein 1 [Panthera tigris]|uniref:GLIPR1-like protein 1 n=1 Tax=Panthera tigris TaxID=9694 RepID=UPI001C6F783E|nr:GLIPR1-like protein 1 [Panthera tigris]
MEPARRVVPTGPRRTGWPSRYWSTQSERLVHSAMVLRKKLSCLWTLGLCLVASKSSAKVPSITDTNFKDSSVKAHNDMRGKVWPSAADMKHMTWDDGLAQVAKAWANKCKFKHNSCLSKSYGCHPTFQYVGENIWLGGFSIFSPRFAVIAWFNETAFYDYNTLSCSKVCGHYTQVVWANSYKVGCAITMCPTLGNHETAIYVCNYGPAGNFPNRPPYTRGVSCSLCAKEETCENKLCRNKELDKTEKYPNWSPQGKAPQQISCNSLCLVSVLLRLF